MNDSYSNLIESAYSLARTAHLGQTRRDGITPYITHPIDVTQRVKRRGGGSFAQAVAYLHDVLEDTKTTAHDLINAGIDEHVVVAVQIITKHPSRSYDEYLLIVKQNHLAREVKIADMLSNLSDAPTDKQIKKYAKGLAFLVD